MAIIASRCVRHVYQWTPETAALLGIFHFSKHTSYIQTLISVIICVAIMLSYSSEDYPAVI